MFTLCILKSVCFVFSTVRFSVEPEIPRFCVRVLNRVQCEAYMHNPLLLVFGDFCDAMHTVLKVRELGM